MGYGDNAFRVQVYPETFEEAASIDHSMYLQQWYHGLHPVVFGVDWRAAGRSKRR